MKVYLSNKPSPDSSFKHHSNLASLDRTFSDSEITSLTIDCFLSSFSFVELEQAIKEVLKKCRIGCEVTIIEPDCNILFRMYTRGDVDLAYFNEVFFESSKKSIMNTDKLQSIIPENFEVQQKYISESSLSVLKIRRAR
tara:strand:- start:3560 stop:3976 length:417 start_codon:yes stop_codon:yes gene_type:complete